MSKGYVLEGQETLTGLKAVTLRLPAITIEDMGTDSLAIDDEFTIVLDVVCSGRGIERRPGGELRATATGKIREVQLTDGPRKPIGEPTLPFEGEEDSE
jgi:hypothetical protein